MDADRYATSYHEAAHAVVSRELCKRGGGGAWLLDGATVVLRSKSGAVTRHARADGLAVISAEGRDVDLVLVELAGAAAEIELLGTAAPTGCDADFAQADARIAQMDIFPDVDAARRYLLHGEARALVRKHRRAIKRVARALRKRGQLSGEEIDELMR
jgi:hypothetical protein